MCKIPRTYRPSFLTEAELEEALTLDDLKRHAGLSDLTKKFRKRRNQVMGPENRTAKLIDVDIDKKNDTVTFSFLTEVTDDYDPGFDYKATEPKQNFKLKPNKAELYEMQIQVVDFFQWLGTAPGELEDLTNKDIEDVFRVANIKLNCDCPSYHFQGLSHYLDVVWQAALYPQPIAPTSSAGGGWKDHHGGGEGIVCKHLSGLVSTVVPFMIPQMRQMLRKKLGLIKKRK